jgi:uncharacterized protein with ParB-like and HNH nuclease domain
MKAYPRPLRDIFDGNYQYAVPLFQRRYVWNEEDQWEPLWKDVQRVAERYLREQFRPHFMGAVVFEQMSIIIGMVNQWQIIDGQQRLTTLQLLIAAARDAARTCGAEASDQADAFDLLTRNPMIKDLSSATSFKVWPSEHDRESYRSAMRAGSPQSVRDACEALRRQPLGHEIPDAYVYFHDRIEAWLAEPGELTPLDRLNALQNAIFNGLQLVVIDLDQVDDAQVIFETLNTRGAVLLAADLVKNYLLHMATDERLDVEQVYRKHWETFDTDDFWRQKVSQGRLFRMRTDVFLQHYLVLQLSEEVASNNLFASYQDYVSMDGKRGAEDYLVSLRHFGDIYQAFFSDKLSAGEIQFFRRLERMEVSTVFPFLLHLYDQLPKASDTGLRRVVLEDIESFLVRRQVCGLTTKNYNKLFIDLISSVRSSTESLPQAVRRFLLSNTGDSERWPDDSEFGQAWRTVPVYRTLSRGRLRMILEALELGVRTKKHEKQPVPARLSIEHLLPQAWQANWPLPADKVDAKEERDALLHTIGNLTLLTDSLNPDVSNSGWSKKRPKILKYSLLALNHYFADMAEWDEQAIRDRSNSLFEAALKIWPRPT